MNRDQLHYFVEVADCGSINKAAERLFITQPSLSRSIRALEVEMGKELIVRTNRGITLTPTGRSLYFYARSILDQFRVLERLKHLSDEKIYSQLSISVDSLFLPDNLILNFYKRVSSSETEIRLIETTAEEMLQNVIDMKSEIGITILNDYQLSVFRKMAEIKEIEVQVLDQAPLMVHLNEKYADTKKEIINVHDLLQYPYIHLPYDFFSNLNLFLTIGGGNIRLTDFRKTITMSNYHAIINMINHTGAFMLGNVWQADELRHSHIHSMKFENCDIVRNFVVVKRKREMLSDAAVIFMDILKKNYGFH